MQVPRTGNEPSNARSPLRLRLVLACFGLTSAVAGVAGFAVAGVPLAAAAFGLLGLVAAVDAAVVLRHIRQGSHYQPGPAVPPYRPVEPERTPRRPRAPVPIAVRRRRYFVLMGTCLTLLVLAWVVIRPFSTGWTVALTLVAMVIPPIAVYVGNAHS